MRLFARVFGAVAAVCYGLGAECAVPDDLIVTVDLAAIKEIAPLAVKAFEIQRLALKREAAHKAELAKGMKGQLIDTVKLILEYPQFLTTKTMSGLDSIGRDALSEVK